MVIDSTSFRSEYEKLYMPLGMYALRIVGNVDDAQDIVQGAFTAAWVKVAAGAEIGNFKSYMYRAVHNAALSSLARSGAEEALGDDNRPDVSEEDIDTSERDAALWRAIDELPERCREVFLMSKRDGMSNAAIAEELDISIKTVENQITKAFAKLRGNEHLSSGKIFFLPFL